VRFALRTRPTVAYGAAILLVILATVARQLLTALIGPTSLSFLTYFPAMFIAAWALGSRPTFVTGVLSALTADYLFLAPIGQFFPKNTVSVVGLALFAVGTIGVAILGEREHRARLLAESLRVEAERSAKEADQERARLAVVVEQLPVGVVMRSADDGRVLLYNSQVERILGRSPAADMSPELLSVFDMRRPDGTPLLPEELPLPRVIHTGEPVSDEVECVRPDGRRVTIHFQAAPVRDATGRITAGVLALTDVTDRHRSEEALRFLAEASAVLGTSVDFEVTLAAVARLAVPTLADWCAVDLVDRDGRLRRIALTHIDPAREPAAWELERRFPARPGSPGRYQVLETGTSVFLPAIPSELLEASDLDPEHTALLQELRPTSYIGVPLAAHGQLFGVLSLVMSDSGRHYTPAELRLAEALGQRAGAAVDNARRHSAAVESVNMLDAVLAASPVGQAFMDRELRYVHVNPALAALHGIPVDHHINRPMGEVLPAWAPALEPLHLRVLETGEPLLEQEVVVPAPGGGHYQLLVSCYPVRDSAGVVRWVGCTKADVTERRRMQEQAQAAQRLEAVGRLAGGVAHEINNALQGVIGFNAFILAQLDDDHPLHSDARQVQVSAERAARIAQQLLAYSRRQVLQQLDLDLTRVVSDFAPMLRQVLGPTRKLVVAPAPPRAMIHADGAQLEQVLLNLALNARDAMPDGGTLTVRIDERTVAEARTSQPGGGSRIEQGDYIELTVEDTGTGMDAETRARVFEPFFTTKPVGQGTGLGLSVVHGIVQQSGGHVWLTAEPGQGTRVTILLPAVAEPTADRSATAVPDPVAGEAPGGSERILVVDDEPVVLEFIASQLRRAGYVVLEASGGESALAMFHHALAEGTEVDLVLTDLVMPGMGGRALGEALGALAPGLPVLYCSGYTGDEVVRRGLIAEGAEFMSKPFAPGELLQRVRALLDRVPRVS
jgi:PAS domain S-box-containing protein